MMSFFFYMIWTQNIQTYKHTDLAEIIPDYYQSPISQKQCGITSHIPTADPVNGSNVGSHPIIPLLIQSMDPMWDHIL